jgi:hypothetical protein
MALIQTSQEKKNTIHSVLPRLDTTARPGQIIELHSIMLSRKDGIAFIQTGQKKKDSIHSAWPRLGGRYSFSLTRTEMTAFIQPDQDR